MKSSKNGQAALHALKRPRFAKDVSEKSRSAGLGWWGERSPRDEFLQKTRPIKQSGSRGPLDPTNCQTRSKEVAEHLISAAENLRKTIERLRFGKPVAYVYNPLNYAWAPYEKYVRKFGCSRKRVVFLGMNPGPFGMIQTGVPFGEVAAVRDWLGIEATVNRPRRAHPLRPVSGFACARSEVSGQRLWGLFAEQFGEAATFFAEHLVMNYCPLAFVEESGRNRTPDKLLSSEKQRLFVCCDEHLRAIIGALKPEWLIGIGDFAYGRAKQVLGDSDVKIMRILHPSPASPAANKNWKEIVTSQLCEAGVWNL